MGSDEELNKLLRRYGLLSNRGGGYTAHEKKVAEIERTKVASVMRPEGKQIEKRIVHSQAAKAEFASSQQTLEPKESAAISVERWKTTTVELEKTLKLAFKPFKKFRQTHQVSLRIQSEYGKGGGFIDTETLKVLYDKIVSRSDYRAVGQENFCHLARLMFLGAENDRPPLYRNITLFEPWCLKMASNAGLDYQENIVRRFVNSKAAVDSSDKSFQIFKNTIGRTHAAKPLIDLGIFAEKPYARLAQTIPSAETTHEGISVLTDDLVGKNSPLCMAVWKARLPRFTEMLLKAFNKKTDFSIELSAIKEECVTANDQLRWQEEGAANALAKAILGPFMIGEGRLPTQAQQDNLRRFWIPIFGNPEIAAENQRWHAVNKEFRELLAHWAKGRSLNESLAFMYEFCDKPQVRASWSERERFWRAYWNAGRISDCMMYVRPGARWKRRGLFDKYAKYCKFGTLTGNGFGDSRVALTLVLDNELMAIEINDVGKIRIGKLKFRSAGAQWSRGRREIYFGISNLDYQEDVMTFGDGIIHNTGWQRNASEVIQRITSLAIPHGARG